MKRSGIQRKTPAEACRIAGCPSKVDGKGMCSKHYQRLKKFGDPEHESPQVRIIAAIEALFERLHTEEARLPGECWEWPGSRNSAGYGTTKRNGENIASRAAWAEVNGPVPGSLLVCHHCDNPPCVRPSHLFVGTKADNATDMVNKGRSLRRYGLENPVTVLTDEQVREIRELRSGGWTCASIAKRFGIHGATVSRIARNLRRSS